MQKFESIDGVKRKVLTKIMLDAKSFNERHKKSAKITTVIALALVVIISIFFQILSLLWGFCKIITGSRKRRLALLLVVVLLIIGIAAKNGMLPKKTVDTMQPTEQAEETSEPFSPVVSEGEPKSSVVSEAVTESEEVVQENIIDFGALKDWDTSGIDLPAALADYPEAVGWIYFEDGHISYPIVQGEDNVKYLSIGPDGQTAWEGAIFLDCRSASDFSDPNSIVYGHNMKDDTMFGSLRDYREDPKYYNNHQFFQVLTPGNKARYQIFAYMDVPDNYVLYDYIGANSIEFVKDAEPVRIKSYMDSEIIVNETKKVVTLSTCTAKDERQFVVLGVLVDSYID
ncbi:MAG: class B sortase [Butyrivibrio sp.]|nr:class B sortase [Butyrivibrio sp.]